MILDSRESARPPIPDVEWRAQMPLDDRAKKLLESDLMQDISAQLHGSTEEDWDFGVRVSAAIFEVLRRSDEGPCTYLVPTEEAVHRYFSEEEHTPESFNGTVGMFLDSIIRDTILADGIDEAFAAGNGAVELKTLGGCVVTARRQEGKLVLIDPYGGRTVISGLAERGPRGDALVRSDDFPMGEMWSSYFAPRPSSAH